MTQIVAYVILHGTTIKQLEEAVKEHISKGWQPLGGLAVSGTDFYQAMVGS
jgi:hypothetical protein